MKTAIVLQLLHILFLIVIRLQQCAPGTLSLFIPQGSCYDVRSRPLHAREWSTMQT